MIRLLLWFFVIYVVWKVINALTPTRRPKTQDMNPNAPPGQSSKPFQDIEEAEYEDLSAKPPPPEK